MGYTAYEIRIPLRISSHNSEQDKIDKQAMEELHDEIEQLVLSDDRYKRIVNFGVEGGA